MAKDQLFRVYEDPADPGQCKDCGTDIVFRETLNGKRMPMQAGAVPVKSEKDPETGRVIAFFSGDDSHFSNCAEYAKRKAGARA